jgi:hypothetical protein
LCHMGVVGVCLLTRLFLLRRMVYNVFLLSFEFVLVVVPLGQLLDDFDCSESFYYAWD